MKMSEEEYYCDMWPADYDGKNLLKLLAENRSPFCESWDAKLLVKEVEEKLETKITDITHISKGSNN